MLNVLVVDDDRTSRAGLIALMPWRDHGMTVIGEAANGVDALSFLRCHKVDLAFVDIEMPMMSGLELIRQVREENIRTRVVIVSVHEEFGLAQEALRGGAIDYIVKNDLRGGMLDDALGNVVKRLGEAALRAADGSWVAVVRTGPADSGPPALGLSELEAVDDGLWLGRRKPGKHVIPADPSEYGTIEILEADGLWRSVVSTLVKQYLGRHAFYEWSSDARRTQISIGDLRCRIEEEGQFDVGFLWGVATSIRWLHDDAVYAEFLNYVVTHRVSPNLVRSLIARMATEIRDAVGIEVNSVITSADELDCWSTASLFLDQLRTRVNSSHGDRMGTSHPLERNLLSALDIMMEEFSSSITSRQVAARVNMSKSSFDAEFRRMFGMSFHEKLVELRMAHAMKLLSSPVSTKIREVSLRCGYLDERHFSVVFKRQTGMLPSEFRESSGSE